jgi:hypothetical protein
MAAPSYVYSISWVAKMLSKPEAWLEEIALMNLDPEDGCLGVIDNLDSGPNEVIAVAAFTNAGIEALKDVVADARRKPSHFACS